MIATRLLLLGACAGALLLGCGDDDGNSTGGTAGDAGTAGTGGAGASTGAPISVTETSFDCILDGTKVRKFYVKNLIGDLEGSLAVANG
ncbi:MAG: hypothetical protein WBG86_18535, partial [Polyangiales bacterium]